MPHQFKSVLRVEQLLFKTKLSNDGRHRNDSFLPDFLPD